MKLDKLYKREDARRMANTMLNIRKEQGEDIPVNNIRRMKALPANVLAQFASRPARLRKLTLVSADTGCVTLRLGTSF